jgi:hypothetical protein
MKPLAGNVRYEPVKEIVKWLYDRLCKFKCIKGKRKAINKEISKAEPEKNFFYRMP